MTSKQEQKVSSLRELPRDIAPARDLWQGIEARIASEAPKTKTSPSTWTRGRLNTLRLVAAAAVVAALAVGVWIGRVGLPGGGGTAVTPSTVAVNSDSVRSPYILDARYNRERAALLQNLQAQLASLPAETRTKVVADLATIHNSMQDLEAALGRDPSNALLQELLVNTYQDEMRVLTAVQEAGTAGKGI